MTEKSERWIITDPPTLLYEAGMCRVRTANPPCFIYKGEVEVIDAAVQAKALTIMERVDSRVLPSANPCPSREEWEQLRSLFLS